MKINTRYEIGDCVYCIIASKVALKTIDGISIKFKEGYDTPAIRYHFMGEDNHTSVEEKRCFATKDELLQSL